MDIVQAFLNLALLGSSWVLWLLVILSVVSVAIIIERCWFFSRIRLNFAEFNEAITDAIIREDYDQAEKICQNMPAIEAQMVLRALAQQSRGVQSMEETMAGYLIAAKQQLDRGLVVLGTLGNNAPFIGLFGTVLGIIEAFHSLAQNTAGGPSVVMAGISEALVATAVGLLVAIPAVIAYNGFHRMIKQKLANAETIMKMILAHAPRKR